MQGINVVVKGMHAQPKCLSDNSSLQSLKIVYISYFQGYFSILLNKSDKVFRTQETQKSKGQNMPHGKSKYDY